MDERHILSGESSKIEALMWKVNDLFVFCCRCLGRRSVQPKKPVCSTLGLYRYAAMRPVKVVALHPPNWKHQLNGLNFLIAEKTDASETFQPKMLVAQNFHHEAILTTESLLPLSKPWNFLERHSVVRICWEKKLGNWFCSLFHRFTDQPLNVGQENSPPPSPNIITKWESFRVYTSNDSSMLTFFRENISALHGAVVLFFGGSYSPDAPCIETMNLSQM